MKIKFIILLFCGSCLIVKSYCQVKVAPVFNAAFFNNRFGEDSLKKNFHTISPSMLVSPAFYSNNIAFFCRQEIKFEKVTKIPLKFRLGSLQQVDYLEGKKGAAILP